MVNEPNCPICGASSWREIGSTTFTREKAAGTTGWRRAAYQTLFEVWAAGRNHLTVRYQLCRDCGFVLYAPRPTVDEVAASYRIYAERDWGGPQNPSTPTREVQRARRLYRVFSPYLATVARSNILDYGGGQGRLMESFVAAGATCHVVDYHASRPVPGVIFVGKTEDDLQSAPVYDAVICSHVVEHLLQPLPTIRKLKTALKEGGLMYVEVPVEIWRRAPHQSEPITHLNFFTPGSLRRLMLEAGFNVIDSRFDKYPHPHGGWRVVASCIAQNAPAREAPAAVSGVREVEDLLNPTLTMRVRRRLFLARDLPHFASRLPSRVISRVRRTVGR